VLTVSTLLLTSKKNVPPYYSENGFAQAFGRLPVHYGTYLFAQALLSVGKSISQGIRQFQGEHPARSSTIFGVFPFQRSPGISGQRAFSLLVFNDLDADTQTQTASPGLTPISFIV
jgi:hypothetical protein